jgi:hypothetical protein
LTPASKAASRRRSEFGAALCSPIVIVPAGMAHTRGQSVSADPPSREEGRKREGDEVRNRSRGGRPVAGWERGGRWAWPSPRRQLGSTASACFL